uniref:Uncharacterized protein n=1 Tax=Dunaliella tertiolecta TaxID=3047 RepID=A0A7S3VJY9_DUNTE
MPLGGRAKNENAPGPKLAIRTPTALALAKEAQEMEAKLEELRKAMERERGMREKSSEGPRWRNGASGLLRGQFRSKQQGTAMGSSHSSPASRTPSSTSRLNSKSSAPMPSPSPSATASVKDGSPPAGELGVSGTSRTGTSRLSSSAGGLGGDARVVPAPGGLRVSQSRKLAARAASPAAPDVLQVHSQQDLGHSSDQGKQSTAESQAGDDPDLREGAFDEAESHKSFMEALNEWRAGNRAQQEGEQQQQQPHQQQSSALQARPQKAYGLKQLKQQAGIQAQDHASTGKGQWSGDSRGVSSCADLMYSFCM